MKTKTSGKGQYFSSSYQGVSGGLAMTEIGTVIDGKYEILREIGRGGMSIVYLAMDTHLNKQWAVKEIRKKVMAK